jgi:NAD(P)-dependent dehydrogenase (short-subunit alcohol dehydrogenase family)
VRQSLDGKVVAVTGTSRGIGAGIATCALDHGAKVIGMSRSSNPAPELRDRDGYLHHSGDICDEPASILLEAALSAHGRVDALVNNAGVEHIGPCWEQPDSEFDEMLAVNLTAPFRLSQAFAQHWTVEGTPGVIVNICSVESAVGWPDPPQSGYAATKGGLLGMTRAMALDLAAQGIRVVAVGPGAIATDMAPADCSYAKSIPLGHAPGTATDVGEAVAYLLSDSARYITGEIVYVDGGYLLQ